MWAWLLDKFQWLIDTIWDAVKAVGGILLDVVIWLFQFVATMAQEMLASLITMLPETVQPSAEVIAVAKTLNYFVPLDFGLGLVVFYFFVWLPGYIGIRYTLKAIPTVWG